MIYILAISITILVPIYWSADKVIQTVDVNSLKEIGDEKLRNIFYRNVHIELSEEINNITNLFLKISFLIIALIFTLLLLPLDNMTKYPFMIIFLNLLSVSFFNYLSLTWCFQHKETMKSFSGHIFLIIISPILAALLGINIPEIPFIPIFFPKWPLEIYYATVVTTIMLFGFIFYYFIAWVVLGTVAVIWLLFVKTQKKLMAKLPEIFPKSIVDGVLWCLFVVASSYVLFDAFMKNTT